MPFGDSYRERSQLGDGEGLFDYQAQANAQLNDMFDNDQTRHANGGMLVSFSLFDHEKMQIIFSPASPSWFQLKTNLSTATQPID